MADETNAGDDQVQDQATDTATPTPDELRELREENARLKASKTALETDLGKRREAEKTRKAAEETERKRRELAGLSEPEKIAERLRESEANREQAEQRAEAAEQARINDANERSILVAAPKHLNADHVDLAWDKIDRSLLTFGDDGKITGGIDKALKKLAEDRPTWGIAKPADRGTGHHNRLTTGNPNGIRSPMQQVLDSYNPQKS